MASCGLVRWPTHGQGASRELISSCRSAGVVSKQHHGPHHCCGRRRSNAEFESLCSRFVEHASTCTTQPLRSMVSATSMRKRRRGALREAPGSDSVRVPRAAHTLSLLLPWGGRSTTPLGPTLPSLVTAREYRSYCALLYVHQVPGHGWARRATSSRGRRHVKCSGRWLCSKQRRRLK